MTATATVAMRKARIFAAPYPVRVYSDHTDATGIVLCRQHRTVFFVSNPGACSDGIRGRQCEQCVDTTA